MELIRNLGTIKDKKGNYQSIALFLCSFCLQEVIKLLGHGLRDKSCGCVQYKLVSESNKGRKHTEERNKKISESQKGKKLTEEHRKNIGEGNKGKSRNKGRRHTEKARKKIKDNHAHLSGENHPMFGKYGELAPNWQGGLSFLPYPPEFNKELKKQVLERDDYTCQNPNCKHLSEGLNVHHIDYNKQNNNLENLTTLCISCHVKTNFNRQCWIEFFKNIFKK